MHSNCFLYLSMIIAYPLYVYCIIVQTFVYIILLITMFLSYVVHY